MSARLNLSFCAPQTGTCEALRSWAMTHIVTLTAEILSLSCNGGVLRASLRLTNRDATHPAFWVHLALHAGLKNSATRQAEKTGQ